MTTISGSKLAAGLPQGKTADERSCRENMIVEAFEAGYNMPLVWLELHARHGGHTATFFVLRDAVQLGIEGDNFRPNVTAYGHQRLADAVDAVLPTATLVKLAWEQGFWISPCTQTPDAKMDHTERMLQHSASVDAKLGSRHQLVAGNVGKHWVLSNKLSGLMVSGAPGVANFGWARTSKAPWNPYQPESFKHNVHHVDYSQVAWLIRRDVILDGSVVDIESIGRDPELFALMHTEPLSFWRIGNPHPIQPLPQPLPEPQPEPEDLPPSKWRDVLKKGMKGRDIEAWQRQLMRDGHNLEPWNDDGDFGNCTHNTTVAWQRERRAKATGEVDSVTRNMIGTPPASRPEIPSGLPHINFKQAKNYTPVSASNPRAIDLIVIHSMEAAETSTTAENVAAWFAGSSAPRASAHYNIDDDSIIQSVRDEDVAWAAPGANNNGLHLEHAGYARQTREQWCDTFSTRMLKLSAMLAAYKCLVHSIPPVFVDRSDLRVGKRGITTHNEVSMAFRKSDHTDPGKNFPMADYLSLIKTEMERLRNG